MKKLDRLALLYENILTAASRVRTGEQPIQDLDDFGARMKQAFAEVESAATRRGYSAEVIRESKFAVVAFIDEAVLTTAGAHANEWAGNTLGQYYFKQVLAGELFFEHLERMRASRESQPIGEVLEVYYYCLLLGYEGKFAGSAKGELLQLTSNLRHELENNFGAEPEFSPDKDLPVETTVPLWIADPLSRQLRWFALAGLSFALICILAFSFELGSEMSGLHRAVQQRVSEGGTP